MTPLLPCPFCGGVAVLEEVAGIGTTHWTVGCTEQDGRIECIGYQSMTTFARKSEAIAAWNTRDGKPVHVIDQLEFRKDFDR